MEKQTKRCGRCGIEIPQERLEAIPETDFCVGCSKKIGGEFEIVVTIGYSGKQGSLKRTGQEVQARTQRKRVW